MPDAQWTVDDDGDLVYGDNKAWLFQWDSPYEIGPIWPEAFAALVADVRAARQADRLREAAEQADTERDHALNLVAAVTEDARRLDRLADDMAAVIRRLKALADNERIDYHRIGFEVVALLSGEPDPDKWSPGEVAALHHARQQEETGG
jgi:hypothetical protein